MYKKRMWYFRCEIEFHLPVLLVQLRDDVAVDAHEAVDEEEGAVRNGGPALDQVHSVCPDIGNAKMMNTKLPMSRDLRCRYPDPERIRDW